MTLTGSSEIMGEWDVFTEWGNLDSGNIVFYASKITGNKRRENIRTFEFRETGKEVNCTSIKLINKKSRR